jgi:capsular polysaccharide biosynthesis protein
MDSKNFDFAWLIGIVRDNFRLFVVVGVVAAILGVVISMPVFMTPKYKSTAIVYPSNVKPYSDESETEQLLQFFEASSIRDSIIEKFDLYEVYEIDPNEEASRHAILEEFQDNFRVGKTKYESVKLEVIDEDPELAKAMADEVLNQINLKYDRVVNERATKIGRSFAKQLAYQRTVLDSIESLISRISRENEILEYGSQTRELVRGYVQALAKNGTQGVSDELKDLLENTQEKGSLIRMLQNLSYMGTMQYDYLSKKYLDQRVLFEGDLNYIDVIVEPEVPDKKFWPVRWLILVISVGLALLTTLVLIILFKRS